MTDNNNHKPEKTGALSGMAGVRRFPLYPFIAVLGVVSLLLAMVLPVFHVVMIVAALVVTTACAYGIYFVLAAHVSDQSHNRL